MVQALQELTTEEAVTAIENNLFEYWACLGRLPLGEFEYSAEMLRYVSGSPFPLFNSIFRARFDSEDVDARIARALSVYRTRRLPMFWWTGPSTRPVDLGQRLVNHGLKLVEEPPGMAADLYQLDEHRSMPEGLEFRRVDDANELARWLEPYQTGFGQSNEAASYVYEVFREAGFDPKMPLQNYTGYLDGKPVACATMFGGAGVVGVYNVTTAAEVRRQGIGAAMTLLSLLDARDKGFRYGILHASPMGYGVYQQLGFQEFCTLQIYFRDFS